MKHNIKTKKLNRTSAHRRALFKNLSLALILNEQIKTTLPKAKVIRPFVEKLITTAKKGNLADRRNLLKILADEALVTKLMTIIADRYKDRHGGYLRIMKCGFRYGDMAPMAIIEFVDRDENAKGSASIQAK